MITLTVLAVFFIVFLVIGLSFHLVGGVLKLVLKLAFCLPCAIICGVIGAALCCTLIFIPLGIACFKAVGFLLNPLKLCFI